MEEEKVQTGEQIAGVADPQTGADEAVVAESQTGVEFPAAGETKEERMIPQERLNQEIEKRKFAESQAAFLQQQLQVNQFQAQQRTQSQVQHNPYGDLTDADLVDVATHKRIMAEQTQSQTQQLQAIQLQIKHPGAMNTINTHLQTAIQNDPTLMTTITDSPDRFNTMFLIAENHRLRLEAEQRQQGTDQNIQQVTGQLLANKQRVLPASAVGGAAAPNAAGRFANMTVDELEAEIERVKAGR